MKLVEKPFADIVAEYRSNFTFDNELLINFGSIVIAVKSNDSILHSLLVNYFREFVVEDSNPDVVIYAAEAPTPEFDLPLIEKEREPGKTKLKEEYCDIDNGRIVRKVITGIFFMFDGDNHLAIGPCIENSNQIVNFVNNRFIEIMVKKKSILLHAAGVARHGRGFAMAGFSGAGKSTLALHIMGRGMDFVSNDRLLARDKGDYLKMYGVIKYPRINPGTIVHNPDLSRIITEDKKRDYLNMPQEELWHLEEKYDAFIDEIYGNNRFTIQAEMLGLIVLNWKRGDTSPLEIKEINPYERYDLAPAFMKMPGVFFTKAENENPDLSEEVYAKHLAKCKVFEVTGGIDFDQTADYFADLLAKEV